MSRRAFLAGDTRLVISTWVDNLYVVGSSPGNCAVMPDILREGFARWDVDIKAGIASVSAPLGVREVPPARYPCCPSFPCLGAPVSNDGGCQAVLLSLISKVRGAIFALQKSRGFGFLGLQKRATVAARATRPILDFFVPLLRPSVALFRTLDNLHLCG